MDSGNNVLGPEVLEAIAQGLLNQMAQLRVNRPICKETKQKWLEYFARVTDEVQSLHDTLIQAEQTADGPTEWIETIRLDVEIQDIHFRYLGRLVKDGPKVA